MYFYSPDESLISGLNYIAVDRHFVLNLSNVFYLFTEIDRFMSLLNIYQKVINLGSNFTIFTYTYSDILK